MVIYRSTMHVVTMVLCCTSKTPPPSPVQPAILSQLHFLPRDQRRRYDIITLICNIWADQAYPQSHPALRNGGRSSVGCLSSGWVVQQTIVYFTSNIVLRTRLQQGNKECQQVPPLLPEHYRYYQ